MDNELVSVILPTYNRIKTIQRSIDSVLDQTYKNIELIIVDDNSTDGTFDLISELYGDDERIIYIMNDSNMGPSGARNAGVDAAHGEFIAFQDSDDIWHPDKLEKQMAIFENAGDEIGMVYCQYALFKDGIQKTIYPSDDFPMESKSGDIFPYLLMVPLCGTPTMLIRKKYFISVGGFSTDIHSLEDYEFSLRFAKKYHILLCNEPLVDANETESSVGAQHKEGVRVECLIMNKYREDLEYLGLKVAKMTSVWTKAMRRGNVESIEDNISMFISDKEYCQTFAVLESKRLAEIFANSNMHIGILFDDRDVDFGNGTRPERGNPGIDESRYELLLLLRYLAKNDNRIAVTVYHFNQKNTLPYDVKSVIIGDKYESVRQCRKDGQNFMIFICDEDRKMYNEINKCSISSICLQTTLPESDDTEFSGLLQNDNIRKIVCTNLDVYNNYSDKIDREKIIYMDTLTSQNRDPILKKWESLLTL